MKAYSTRSRRPKEADANRLGYVFARKRGRIGFEGTPWNQVKWPEYEEWGRIVLYAKDGTKIERPTDLENADE